MWSATTLYGWKKKKGAGHAVATVTHGVHFPLGPGEHEAEILKNNLLRLEVIIRKKVQFAEGTYQAFSVIDDALETLVAQLNIKGKEGETFANDVNNLRKQIPRQGLLVPFSPNAPFYLLAAPITGTPDKQT